MRECNRLPGLLIRYRKHHSKGFPGTILPSQFVIRQITGELFDQSADLPVEFGLQQVISGWTEGLQLMSAGDKFRLYLHPNLAYGAGNVGQIPPNSVLIFDIELLEIR